MAHSYVKIKVGVYVRSDFDLDEFYQKIKELYNVGYIGMFSSETNETSEEGIARTIFIQGINSQSRMSPKKVRKVLQEFVTKITNMDTFRNVEGMPVQEIGVYRSNEKVSIKKPNVGKNISDVTLDRSLMNAVQGNNNNIKSVVDNRVIHIHINAFGNEDISHVTPEKIEELVGEPKEKIDFMQRNLYEAAKLALYEKAWNNHRINRQRMVKKWKTIEACRRIESGKETGMDSLPVQERSEIERALQKRKLNKESRVGEDVDDVCSVSSSISDLSIRLEDEVLESDSDYDSDCSKPEMCTDDEENERKEFIAQSALLLEYARMNNLDFMIDFFELLLSNPRNANLKGHRKDGFTFYKNGEWTKKLKNEFMNDVSDNIIQKSVETLKMVKKFHTLGEVSLFAYKYSKRIIMSMKKDMESMTEFEKHIHPDKLADYSKLVNSIERIGERIKKVERRTGKRVKRVDGTEFGMEKVESSKYSNWDDI